MNNTSFFINTSYTFYYIGFQEKNELFAITILIRKYQDLRKLPPLLQKKEFTKKKDAFLKITTSMNISVYQNINKLFTVTPIYSKINMFMNA